jgi:hypothetical protein
MEPTFETAIEGLEQMGASVKDRNLVDMLQRHGTEEGALLERYQRFAEEASLPAVRYLVRLIIEDESRHHRLLAELANAIAWGWSGNSPVRVPPELATTAGSDGQLAQETMELLGFEKKDKEELRRLRRELRDYEDTTLWALIIDIMLQDTEKHARILTFISDHTN